MSKPKISAKELVQDLKAGFSDSQLMEKYGLNAKGLQSVFSKLTQAGIMGEAFFAERSRSADPPKQERPRKPEMPPAQPEPKVPDLFLQVAEDIKKGLHDNEIMLRHELSPGKLNDIKSKLTELRLLEPSVIKEEADNTKPCPFCSTPIPVTAGKCVHCGHWLKENESPESGESRSGEKAYVEDEPYEEKECPWEERANYGTASAFFQTAARCLLTPKAFFSKLPLTGGFGSPILFAVFSAVVSLLVGFLAARLFMGGGIGLTGIIFVMVIAFILLLIAVPVAFFIWSGILHGILLLLGGAREGYQATFRVVAYSSVSQIFNAIPIVGTIASLWGLVLTVIGLRETHKTSTAKSVITVLTPFLIMAAIVASIAIPAFVQAYGSAKSAQKAQAGQKLSGEKIPVEVCSALDSFIFQIDSIKDVDPKAAQSQLNDAMKELDDVLAQFPSHKDMPIIKGKAAKYAVASIARSQLDKLPVDKSKIPKAFSGDAMRSELTAICK